MWIQISSGRGPVECQRSVFLFYKTLSDELKKSNIKIEPVDFEDGEISGAYKSVLISADCKADKLPDIQGTIQWICESPYRKNHKRKNWFINIEFFDEPDDKTVEYSKKDFKIETARNTGKGGQNVNKTETAVKITHIPTGLSAIAREERSQYLNKKLAFSRIIKLLDNCKKQNSGRLKKEIWNQHNELERGNPKRIYKDKDFKLFKILS